MRKGGGARNELINIWILLCSPTLDHTYLSPDHTYLSDALEYLVIDGVLELHAAVEGVCLVVLHQLGQAVKGGRTDGELAALHLDATVSHLPLCPVGVKVRGSKCEHYWRS